MRYALRSLTVSVLSVVLLLSLVALAPSKAAADVADLTTQTGCSTLPSFNGVVNPPAGAYDLYARLGQRGDRAQVSGFVQVLGAQQGQECQSFGTNVAASGDGWTSLGIFIANGSNAYVFQLSSTSLAGLPSANRPAIMLVPYSNPPCMPTTECTVRVDGQTGYVRPPGTLLNQDSLHVMQVINPAHDTLEYVDYYVDDQEVYTTPTLKPFEWKYVSNDEQTVTAIAYYKSGQEIQIPETPPSGLTYNPISIVGMFISSAWWLRVLLALGIVLLLAWIGFRILARIHQKRDWEDEHGITAYIEAHETEAQRRRIQVREHLLRMAEDYARMAVWPLVTIAVIAILFMTNNAVATLYTIDGESMQNTYMNRHTVVLDKWPVTWARINHTLFVPKRGQVVVVHAVFGNTTAAIASQDGLTLIKRVIGLPGDHIVINNGQVTIYNAEHPNGFNFDAGQPWDATMQPTPKTEHLDLQLGPDEIFVSGDNRPESIDSRFNGPIHINNVIGIVTSKFF